MAASASPATSTSRSAKTSALRVNGMYENGDSFRRHVDLERYGINPTVGIMAGPDTRIDLSYEYLHDRRTTDRGVPSGRRWRPARPSIEPLDGFDKTFFGDPDKSYAKADVHVASFAVEHQFGERPDAAQPHAVRRL